MNQEKSEREKEALGCNHKVTATSHITNSPQQLVTRSLSNLIMETESSERGGDHVYRGVIEDLARAILRLTSPEGEHDESSSSPDEEDPATMI